MIVNNDNRDVFCILLSTICYPTMQHQPATESLSLVEQWKKRRLTLLLTFLVLVGSLILFSRFVMWVETRVGVQLDDPILSLLTPVDLTWQIFALIYIGLLIGVGALIRHPDAMLLTMRTYSLLLLVRIGTMYVTPLAPPKGMIVLQDPVAGLGPGGALTNDLFFSGHTAIMVLFYLTAQNRALKVLFLLFALLIGIMLLLQHVHYTVDVLAAPFFVYGCYWIASRLQFQS